MPNDRIEGLAQGIRAKVRELERQGGSERGRCCFLHFFDPNHCDGSATVVQSARKRSCSGITIGALVRHGNVNDNALVDQLCNGRRVGLG